MTRGSLEKAPVGGGPPQKICDVSSYMGGSWGRDGQIVFGGFPNVGLLRVSANGGIPQFLARPKGNATQYINPEHLAESDTILFTILREGEMSIAALPPDRPSRAWSSRMALAPGIRRRATSCSKRWPSRRGAIRPDAPPDSWRRAPRLQLPRSKMAQPPTMCR